MGTTLYSFASHKLKYTEFEYYIQLIRESDGETGGIGLYAVCTRYPWELVTELELRELKNGVYEVKVLSCAIKIIVLREIERGGRNAIWNLFSLEEDKVTNDEYKGI